MRENFGIIAGLLIAVVCLAGCTGNRGETPAEQIEEGNSAPRVELVHIEDEQKVDVRIEGELFTSYLYGDRFKKPILYPVLTSGGIPVTRGYPLNPRPGESEDHPHQTGVWLNYGDVNGLDFWNHSDAVPPERKEHYGTIIHRNISNLNSGDEGTLETVAEWVGPEGEVLLTEQTRFVFRSGGEDGGAGVRTIDRITRLTAPPGEEISLTDNKEGMLGLRVRRELEHPDEHEAGTGIYKSSEGQTGYDVWGTRARWMKLTGTLDDTSVSIAIFDHPENVGYPTYWHARGYGLFAANPLGMKELSGGEEELNYSLDAGETVEFKYRIMIRSGEEPSDEETEREWQAWEEL